MDKILLSIGKIFLFLLWMRYPPNPNIDYQEWLNFRQTLVVWIIWCSLLFTALIVGLYWWSARRRKIRSPDDLFVRYKPMYWLLLAFVPMIAVFVVYILEFQKLLDPAYVLVTSYIARAVIVGLWAGFLTFVLAYFLMWVRGLTPPKFLYRPRWLIYYRKGLRR